MPNIFNNSLDSLERLKEVLRLQFEYFRQLSTLSTASIGAMIAFFTKIPPTSWYIIPVAISLLCFFTCLIISMYGMTMPTNMVFYSDAIWTIATSSQKTPPEREQDAKEYIDKYGKGIEAIKRYDRISRYTFIIGVISFLAFALMSLICRH